MGGAYVGIDLGGTTISAVAADDQGRIVRRVQVDTLSNEGPDAVIGRMARLAGEVADAPVAIGVGIPGLVDVKTGVTRFLPNMPGNWPDVPVAARLREVTGCPVRILNDARCAALGELTFGQGRDRPGVTMAYFTLGTGIGGAVVVEGKLRLGPLGAAGELGHQTILPDGPLCGCGNRGCLEALASGPAIVGEAVRMMRSGLAPTLHRMADGRSDRVTPRLVAEAAREGDAATGQLIRRVAEFLGIGVVNLVVALHPQLVVFAGGVAGMGDLLLDPIRDVLKRRVGMFPPDDVELRLSALGADAGALGAVALARDGIGD